MFWQWFQTSIAPAFVSIRFVKLISLLCLSAHWSHWILKGSRLMCWIHECWAIKVRLRLLPNNTAGFFAYNSHYSECSICFRNVDTLANIWANQQQLPNGQKFIQKSKPSECSLFVLSTTNSSLHSMHMHVEWTHKPFWEACHVLVSIYALRRLAVVTIPYRVMKGHC